MKIAIVHCLDTLWVENFTLSRTVKEIEANMRFSIFGKSSKKAAIFGESKIFFFENCQEYIAYIPCGPKISTKLLYLTGFRR